MIIKDMGLASYVKTLAKMQNFTDNRTKNSEDELWLLEHNAVFTSGIRDSSKNLLTNPDNIPLIITDRGGMITYHGRGQLIIYCLFDIKRLGIGVKKLVYVLEQTIIELLSYYNIQAQHKNNAPGVYVNDKKISALGLKIKNGYTYHGISLNMDMDLTPFSYIEPCGYKNLQITQMINETDKTIIQKAVAKLLTAILVKNLTYNSKLL